MERTSIDPRRSRHLPWFEDGRTSFQHNADYMKRLSNLRDELINQEQTHLANALVRLRQRQNGFITNRGYRPRETHSFYAEPMPRKSLITTVEHFQKTRPRRSPPRIMPLEGKQIVDPQQSMYHKSPRSPHMSDKDTGFASASSSRSAEESFRLNLQRLIQPTSSIPNIGRKSTTSDKNLVLESSQLRKKSVSPKNSFYSSSGPSERGSPFKGLHKGGGRFKQLVRPDSEDFELSPSGLHYDTSADQDRMNLDHLKDYYCIYYLPTNTPTIPFDEELSFYDDSIYSSRKSESDQNKKMFSAVEGRSILKPIDSRRGSKMTKRHRTPRGYHENKPFVHFTRNNYLDSEHSTSQFRNANKRQIVVDMPAIVFNSASPEHNSFDYERQHTGLRRTYKQNELRERELKNLIEDVKELNLRNDTLTGNIHTSPGE